MATSTTTSSDNKTLLYVVLGLVGLGVGGLLLGILYFLCSYLSLNAALGLDRSLYGRVGGPLGYALLGLGLGAAAGAMAARHRYRLHPGVRWAALGLGAGLLALALVPGASSQAGPALPEAVVATFYEAVPGRVSCGACTRITASGAYAPQNGNSYEATNLLRRDSTSAWISEVAADADNPLAALVQLHLTVGPLPAHRLVGLRLRNGYCKSAGTYQSFGRVQKCLVQLSADDQHTWTLADATSREFFLPLTSTADSTKLTISILSSYVGDKHPEAALAWVVPVFDPIGK